VSEPITRYVVGRREDGKRLDHYLHQRIPGLSRARIQLMIRERVTLSWQERVRVATPVRAEGVIEIGWVPLNEEPLDITIPVLTRGDGWLAVDKPAGIPVHPVNRVRENTLIRMLRRQEQQPDLRLAHRLDRETSGALLVAEDAATARQLSRAFAKGQMRKEYLAWLQGELADDEGVVDQPIGNDEASPIYVKLKTGCGKPARTRFRVERREVGRTLVRMFPATGRRHQLRLHALALGHPILGDILYGRDEQDYLAMVAGDDPRPGRNEPLRQLLHCARMALAADDGPTLDVHAPLPSDMR